MTNYQCPCLGWVVKRKQVMELRKYGNIHDTTVLKKRYAVALGEPAPLPVTLPVVVLSKPAALSAINTPLRKQN